VGGEELHLAVDEATSGKPPAGRVASEERAFGEGHPAIG